jgi:hypothetical protein
MATTKVSQIIIKKDILTNLPVLAPGEFMLATDEQRLFLGQLTDQRTGDDAGTDTTTATVKFTVKSAGSVVPLDLDGISEFSISVYDGQNPTSDPLVIPGSSVDINDDALTFNHGLGRAPAFNDTFTLHYNKEVTSFTAETGTKLHSTAFTNSGNVVKEIDGIEFNSDIKNTIVMNYTLFNVAGKMRKGTLTILVSGTTNSNIEDKYFGDSELSDVEFSLTNTGKIFKLNFNTSITTELNFDYTQTSTQNS